MQSSRAIGTTRFARVDAELSRWADVRAVGAAFVAFLLGAAFVGARPLPAAVEIMGFAVVVAAAAWFASAGAAACIAVIGYLFVSGFVEGTEGSLSWGGWSDVILIAALETLALVASAAGRRPSNIALRGRMHGRVSSILTNHKGEQSHG